MAFSLRDWQKGAISRLLRLGKDLGDGESAFVRKAKGGKRKQVRQGPL